VDGTDTICSVAVKALSASLHVESDNVAVTATGDAQASSIEKLSTEDRVGRLDAEHSSKVGPRASTQVKALEFLVGRSRDDIAGIGAHSE